MIIDPSHVALSIGRTQTTAAFFVDSHVEPLNRADWNTRLGRSAPRRTQSASPCQTRIHVGPTCISIPLCQGACLFFPFLRDDALIQNQWIDAYNAEKGLATFSTEDVLPLSPNVRKRDSDDPSREYKRPGSPPLKKPATVQSKFRPARPVMSEEVIEDILDALPAISIHVRELKRQIAMLQESNETMESRILQLEKQYVYRKCANAAI